MDSNDSDERKYSSEEEEEVDRIGTSHDVVKKRRKEKLETEANKNNTKKPKKNVSVLDYIKKSLGKYYYSIFRTEVNECYLIVCFFY